MAMLAASAQQAAADDLAGLLWWAVQSFCDLLVAANMNGFDLPLRLTGQKLSDGVTGMAGELCAIKRIMGIVIERRGP